MTTTIQKPRLGCFAAFLLFAFAPGYAHADGAAAPALFDVEEVIVQVPHFGDNRVTATCGLSADELSDALVKTFQDNGVPATSVADAKPAMQGRARINMVTDVFSLNSQGLECTSWISLTAETNNSVHVPPVDLARNVAVVYWHEGSMLASGQTTHDQLVMETIRKLARHFADQYKQDQPNSANK